MTTPVSNRPRPNSPETVSYTHLDVYKRQHIDNGNNNNNSGKGNISVTKVDGLINTFAGQAI